MSATPGGAARVDHHRGRGELPTSRAAQVVVAGPSAPHVRGDRVDLSPLWRPHARGRPDRHSREATEQKPLRVTVHRVIRHGGRRGQASARGRELASTALSAAPRAVGGGGGAAGGTLAGGGAGRVRGPAAGRALPPP